MRSYKIYQNTQGHIFAVKQGWSWPGFFFTWIWCFIKGLNKIGIWLIIIYIIAWIFNSSEVDISNLFPFIGLGVHIWLGADGNRLREQRLKEKGFNFVEENHGVTPEDSIARYKKGINLRNPSQPSYNGTSKIKSPTTDKRIQKSLDIIMKLGKEPIEKTIFDLSIHLTTYMEKDFKEIDKSNRTFVLWELSMFFSILAYTCRPNLTDKDYKEMYNTFGVMAREIGTHDLMDKNTKKQMYNIYTDTIFKRINDYQGGTAQSFCMNLFKNISRVGDLKDSTFEFSSHYLYGETLQFLSVVQDPNVHYAHIK